MTQNYLIPGIVHEGHYALERNALLSALVASELERTAISKVASNVENILRFPCGLAIWPERWEVMIGLDDRSLNLRKIHFQILKLLAEKPKDVIGREVLQQAIGRLLTE